MARYKKYIFSILIVLVILLGILLRFKAYMFNRSLWFDEAYLFVNIYYKSYIELFGPLFYIQSAPPLFLIIEKIFVTIFGIKEQILRLFPFICSILSVPLFFIFSKIFLKKKLSLILANMLFAVNIQLLFYSQELKQYSSDVLIFLFSFIILNNLTIKNMGKRNIIIYFLIIIILPLLSIPSYFVIGGWILRELITYKKECIKKIILINIPLFITSAFYCIYVVIPQHHSFMQTKFAYSIVESGFISLSILKNIDLFIHNFNYYFRPGNINLVHILSIIFGLYLFIKNRKSKEILLLFCTILMPIICSGLKLYPMYERIFLYIIPVIIIFLTKVFDFEILKNKVFALLLFIIFAFSFRQYDLSYLEDCYNSKIWYARFDNQIIARNARKLMETLKSNYNNNDTVIVNYISSEEYEYYKKYYNFKPSQEFILRYIPITMQWNIYVLDRITQPNKTYWFFYSCDHTNFEVEALKKWAKKHIILQEYSIDRTYMMHLKTR